MAITINAASATVAADFFCRDRVLEIRFDKSRRTACDAALSAFAGEVR